MILTRADGSGQRNRAAKKVKFGVRQSGNDVSVSSVFRFSFFDFRQLTTVPAPSLLARLFTYRASSARFTSSPGDSPERSVPQPAEKAMVTETPWHSNLWPLNRVKTYRTSSFLQSGSSTRNSSPPKR